MDGLSFSKVADTIQHFEEKAAQGTNKSTKGNVEGLSDTRPQTPPAGPAADQGETKKMAELSIKEQEVKPSAPSVADQVPLPEGGAQSTGDKQTAPGADGRSDPDGGSTDKTEGTAAAVEADVDQSTELSSDVSEEPDAGSVSDGENSVTAAVAEAVIRDAEDAVGDAEGAVGGAEEVPEDIPSL